MSLAEQPMIFSGPAGLEDVHITQFSIREQLGRPFQATIDLASADAQISAEEVLGQPASVRVLRDDGSERYYHGIVSRFALSTTRSGGPEYRATLVPWLWLLTRSSDCRIYQDMKPQDIIASVFKDLGFGDYEMRLFEDHAQRRYCVQYRETHFNFVSRLMEEEGIYYFFEHAKDRHTIVLTDSVSAHDHDPALDSIAFTQDATGRADNGRVTTWELDQEVQSGVLELRSDDFQKVGDPLASQSDRRFGTGSDGGALFDYPGNYTDLAVGNTFAKFWLEAIQADQQIATGLTSNRNIGCGRILRLDRHPMQSQNKPYLVVQTQQTGSLISYRSGSGDSFQWRCSFSVIDKTRQFRSPRTTPKPVIRGPQTAVVTGPDSERVHVDNHGRVKVRFHWDRYGLGDGGDSCWIRVSQNWAGDGYGGMFLPHVGHEVIVEFLEGDPDRPIITGRVYNGKTALPKELPENKFKSIIRDHYGNELMFDGTTGDEHIVLHCPHHESVMILGRSRHCLTESDEGNQIKGDERKSVEGDSSFKIKGNKVDVVVGTTAKYVQGANGSITSGVKLRGTVGAKIDLNLATSFEYTCGMKYKMSQQGERKWGKSYYRSSERGITHDSKESIILASGDTGQTRVRLNKEAITLSYGTDPAKSRVNKDAKKISDQSKAALLGAVAALNAAAAASFGKERKKLCQGVQTKAQNEKNTKRQTADFIAAEKQCSDGVHFGISHCIATTSALAAWIAGTEGRTSKPEHKNVKSFLAISEEGVLISAQDGSKGPSVTVYKNGMRVNLQDKVMAIANVKKAIVGQWIEMDSGEVKFGKYDLNHPNLKVKK